MNSEAQLYIRVTVFNQTIDSVPIGNMSSNHGLQMGFYMGVPSWNEGKITRNLAEFQSFLIFRLPSPRLGSPG